MRNEFFEIVLGLFSVTFLPSMIERVLQNIFINILVFIWAKGKVALALVLGYYTIQRGR